MQNRFVMGFSGSERNLSADHSRRRDVGVRDQASTCPSFVTCLFATGVGTSAMVIPAPRRLWQLVPPGLLISPVWAVLGVFSASQEHAMAAARGQSEPDELTRHTV